MRNHKERVKFIYLYNKIQNCCQLSGGWLKFYFEECYKDLLSRSEVKADGLTLDFFAGYINIPLAVANKIFRVFDEDAKGHLTQSEFSEGMYSLYFGSLKILEELSFKIFDFENNGEIHYSNVNLLLLHLQNNCEIREEGIDHIIQNFFKLKCKIKFEDYVKIIRNYNSNVFILFLLLLYCNQPFSEDALEYFKKHNFNKTENVFPSESENETESEDDLILEVDKEVSILFKYTTGRPFHRLTRKYESHNITNLDNLDHPQKKISEMNFKSKLNFFELDLTLNRSNKHFPTSEKSSINLNSHSSSRKNSLLSQEENNSSSFSLSNISSFEEKIELNESSPIEEEKNEVSIYKYGKDNKMHERKIVIVDKDMFSFKYSKSKKKFNLEKVISLSGYIASRCEDLIVEGQTLYPIALLIKYRNAMVNVNNIYFCKNKNDFEKLFFMLKRNLNIRFIEDYYDFMGDLGEGHFGKVKLGMSRRTKKKVAIKVYDKSYLSIDDIKIVRNEIDVMGFIKNKPHENIIQPIDLFEDKKFIYIVMELLHGGTLQAYLNNNKGVLLKEDKILSVADQIKSALVYMSKAGIIHRDIKADNILLVDQQTFHVKLIDFGLSKIIGENETTSEGFGTLIYSAPEILLKQPYNRKIDIWSYGILLYFLSTTKYPFDGKDYSITDITRKICYGPLVFPPYFEIGEELKILIQNCLTKKPSERIDVTKL